MTEDHMAHPEEPIDRSFFVHASRVIHPTLVDALGLLYQYGRDTHRSGKAVCLAAVGEGKSGKSRTLKEFAGKHHLPAPDNQGLTAPIIRISVPPSSTVGALVKLILDQLGDPIHREGAARKQLREVETVIALDELQQAVPSTSSSWKLARRN